MNTKDKIPNEAHSEPLQQCSVVGSAFEMSWNLTAVEKQPSLKSDPPCSVHGDHGALGGRYRAQLPHREWQSNQAISAS